VLFGKISFSSADGLNGKLIFQNPGEALSSLDVTKFKPTTA
jgi:hypothetical protein